MRHWIQNTEIAEMVLDVLLAGPLATLDVVAATRLTKHLTVRKMREFAAHPETAPSHKLMKHIKDTRREYLRYHSFLGRLKKQGLVAQSGTGKSKHWLVTAAGKRTLEIFKKRTALLQEAITPGGITIVSYDIPEKIHAERDAMREILKLFGFTFVHQSLWYANVTVEKKFLEYLRERKLLDYVHIFQVSKTGTLEQLEK